MIDDHGNDESKAHAEHDPSTHEGDAAVWSDDRPPADDFADASAVTEEMPTVSQETAEDDAALPAVRSRSMLPLFVGIAGVLILGGVVYWQLGQSTSAPVMPMTNTQVTNTQTPVADKLATPTPATTQDAKPAAAQSDSASVPPLLPNPPAPTGHDDISTLYKSAPTAPTAATSGSTNSVTPTVSPTLQAEVPPTATAETTMLIPPSAPPSAHAEVAPSPHAPPSAEMPGSTHPEMVVQQVMPSSNTASGASMTQANVDALSIRVEALQKSLDEAKKQLGDVSNMVTASPALSGTAIETRLNNLEQNMAQLEAAKGTQAKKPAAVKSAATHIKKATKSKSVMKKSKTTQAKAAKSSKSSAQAAKTSAHWVLRAATPSEAWVSASATSPDLKHVRPGDKLAGIGEVRAIHQSPNGWEIQGSEGSIR